MKEKMELTDEMIAEITGGGYSEEWRELKDWAVRHNPEWEGRDPSTISDGPVIRYLFLNIPEYDGSAHRGDGPTTYFVKGQSVNTMNHEQFMALITSKYGA